MFRQIPFRSKNFHFKKPFISLIKRNFFYGPHFISYKLPIAKSFIHQKTSHSFFHCFPLKFFSISYSSLNRSQISENKTIPLTVQYEGNEVIFDVPSENYTVGQLLQDVKEYWGLTEIKTFWRIQKAETGNTLPSSAILGKLINSSSTTILKLLPLKPIQIPSVGIEKEIQIEQKNIIAEEEEIKEEGEMSIAKSIETILQEFFKVSWVQKQTKMHGISSLTLDEFNQAIKNFGLFVEANSDHPMNAFLDSNISKKTFVRKIYPLFLEFIKDQKFDLKSRKKILEQVTDLSSPKSWYNENKKFERSIHLHLGPTNSGKTHSALTRLSQSQTGIYLGPLRLLAHEIYEKLNNQGVPCNLITGQQIIQVPNAKHYSCTVEMADLTKVFDVAVIDEIQMIANRERGSSWTRALLGLQAKEIHLCGDDSALGIIQRLCESENINVVKYKRLSPLVISPNPFHFSKLALSKGDCIICFSKKEIFKMKQRIEQLANLKCCIIYGALPPESRTQQALLFNDPHSGYDVLIASDAIGMGLNLNIKRIIFSTLQKFDGQELRDLTTIEIKQIAGRAGRFGSLFPTGIVTCFDERDRKLVKYSLQLTTDPIQAAGLFPNYEQIENFSRFNPPFLHFSLLLNKFIEKASLDEDFFLCDHSDLIEIAKMLDEVDLTLKDRYIFISSPVDTKSSKAMSQLLLYANQYSTGSPVPFTINLKNILRIPVLTIQLEELETAHRISELYIWLSLRLENFTQRNLANETKNIISEQIGVVLDMMNTRNLKREFEQEKRKINELKFIRSHRKFRRHKKIN